MKITLRLLAPLLVPMLFLGGKAHAGQAAVGVTATVLSKNVCKFVTASANLAFGAINPASTSNATASANLTIRCVGSSSSATFLITQDSGLYSTGVGANRMRNTSVLTEYLPYSLSISPSSATIPKNVDTTIAIGGTITPSNFQNAYVGNYQDTVILTIVP